MTVAPDCGHSALPRVLRAIAGITAVTGTP
jgi:hypothetical protein